ncbi:ABC transporter ATP-binding protein [Microvirga lotononidis]|uniref:ABC-type branched-chain amino acid transport system, ATPase component n=1 Tax=Microvirga lotononidis TaxID=864069 RepID=I4YY03_9HYPH|nr:ABC transporter ATP-binding protein [Microvirga lotononidis]EIM28845.1 ABC-type branched-chain amino acid transport system, ATPase component [Microvirga lotononidis]WQO25428.1 ABC transporter ATP-binding protein [Microvirga lotononidis]
MLKIQDVHLAYGPISAVRKATIEVEAGEVVAIVGGNGAGKSTLLKGIAGLMPVSSGQILFEEEDVTRLPPHRRVARGIALSPEGRQVFPDQSVYDNLTLGAYFRRLSNEALEAEVEEQFKLFPRLRERRNQLAVTLSGGEQQMLAIARALMGKPRLLLLDEPSLGLAPKIIQEIFDIIVSLRRSGITILLVEQMANMALAIADRAYVLETGNVTLSGTGQQLLHDPKVRAAYLGVSHGTA